MFLVLLFFLILNLFVKSHTPQITGKITDSETKKPLEDIKISVIWVGTAGFLGGAEIHFKEETYFSDKDGNFVIPEFTQRRFFSSMTTQTIMFYTHGYEVQTHYRYVRGGDSVHTPIRQVFERNLDLPENGIVVSLYPLKSADEYFDNLNSLEYAVGFDNLTRDYITEEYKLITEKFPNDPRLQKR